MATITLRAYLEELNTLIDQEALEEVIGHCRHILQYFPKNLETYRLLGKALLEKARYDEAGQVFPRILSADPSDFIAHVGLSTIYENQNEVRRALWHMERAFEQMPNQTAIGDEIRRLYEMMGKVPPQKIKMTRGALAKQYANNGMYDQALSEVRQALQENPQRIDLKILLAETLWQANYPVEAGEAALEVLQVLPDSLAANILMAKLWLVSQRPDDAKPFLKHVEDLAPYESLKLIYQANNQKAEVPDTAFTLARLDWTTAAAAGFGDESPDWVNKIGDVFQFTDTSAVTGAESVGDTTAPMAAVSDDSPSPFAADDIPDWISGTGSLRGDAGSTTLSEDLPDWFAEGADFGGKPQTGELSAPEEWFSELSDKVSQTGSLAQPTAPKEEEGTGFTGLFDDMGDEDADDDLDSLRAASAAPSQAEIDVLIASARGESVFDDEADESPPPNWLDSTSDEPEWGDEEADDFTPDWFKVESSDDDLSTLLDEGLEEAEVDLYADLGADDDEEFATLFGDMSEGEAEDDLAGMFGSDSETFDAGLFSEPDTAEAEDLLGSSSLETPDDDLEAMFGNMQDDAESEGFASMFGEGDLDEPSLFGEDESDLASVFDQSDSLETIGNLGTQTDDDFGGLFGEELESEESFLTEMDFSSTETPTQDAEPDLANLFAEEDEEPETEADLGGLFDEDEAEPELDSLFGGEVEGLDTSWLNDAALGDLVEADEKSEPEADLGGLFGEEVEVDTSFLSATGFGSTETPAEDEAEPDLASLFGGEAEGLDTSWLSEDAALGDLVEAGEEPETDLGGLFGSEVEVDTSFLSATGFGSTETPAEDEEPELDSLFGGEAEGLDTSWLNDAALGDLVEADEEPEPEADLGGLFGDEVEVDTSFLSATGFGSTETPAEDEEPESDLAGLFGSDAQTLHTGWLTEASSEVSESEADELDLDLFGEETLEFDTIDELEADEEYDSLFMGTPTDEEAALPAESFSFDRMDADEEDGDEFDALFADEVGINTGFLKSTGFEENDLFADLPDEEAEPETSDEVDMDEAFGTERPQVMDTSWLSSSVVEDADFGTSGDEDFVTMFSDDTDMSTQPVDALGDEDWLGNVESSDLTTEEVDSLDSLLEDDELPEPTVDDLAELFDDEGITVDTSFLHSMEASPQEDLVTEDSTFDEPAEDDFGALFDSPTGVTGFLQTTELVEPDDSALDEFLADAVAEQEAEQTSLFKEEKSAEEPEVDAALGDALFAVSAEGEEDLDLDSLFGGALASEDFDFEDGEGEDVLLRQTKDEEPSAIDSFFDEIEETGLDEEPDLEDFFDPADLDFVTSEVQTISPADHMPNEIEDFMSGQDAVTIESVDDEDLDAIFGSLGTTEDDDFGDLLEIEMSDNALEVKDTFGTSDAELDELFADADEEEDFASLLEEDSLETANAVDFGELAGMLEEEAVDTFGEPDEFTGLREEDSFEAVDEADLEDLLDDEDELIGSLEFGDELDDEFMSEDDLADLLEEDDVSLAETEGISDDEFASVFSSFKVDETEDEAELFAEESFEDEPFAFGEAESLEEIDDDLFEAMTTGGDTIGLIEDSQLAEEVDWVTGFDEAEEVAATEPPPPVPPMQLPEAPRVQFKFNREPRWMRVLKSTQSATMVDDVAVKSDDSGLFDTFDELLDDDFDDLLDDDLTDWLE